MSWWTYPYVWTFRFCFCSAISEHLPFLLECKPIPRLLLSLRVQVILKWFTIPLSASFVVLMILVQWILHKSLSRHLQYHLKVQVDLYPSRVSSLTQYSWDDRDPLMTHNVLSRLFLASLITVRFVPDFRQIPRRYFLKYFPFFVHCCFCFRYHRGKKLAKLIILEV